MIPASSDLKASALASHTTQEPHWQAKPSAAESNDTLYVLKQVYGQCVVKDNKSSSSVFNRRVADLYLLYGCHQNTLEHFGQITKVEGVMRFGRSGQKLETRGENKCTEFVWFILTRTCTTNAGVLLSLTKSVRLPEVTYHSHWWYTLYYSRWYWVSPHIQRPTKLLRLPTLTISQHVCIFINLFEHIQNSYLKTDFKRPHPLSHYQKLQL